jgi:glycosyltransferase involved in cell wall biosynthesis
MAVNERAPEGNMVRRARVLREFLRPEFEVDIVAAPDRPPISLIRACDLVYVIDPGRVGFPAAVMGRLARRLVVVEMGDPQAALYRAQGRSRRSVLVGAAIDGLVTRYASAVVVRGNGLTAVLDVRVPWVEIPDGVDVDRFRPGLDGDLRRTLGIPPYALVAGLVGSLRAGARQEAIYGWDLVEALSLLRNEPVWGLVVGDGTGAEPLRRRAKELGVADRLVMPGFVPHSAVPPYIAAMDVCLSRQSNDAVGRSRTTAKLPEYLACDRYVLATAVGGAADVLPREMLLPYRGAHDPLHPRRLADRLAELVPLRAQLRRGAGTRRIALEHYRYERIASRLADFLRAVVE